MLSKGDGNLFAPDFYHYPSHFGAHFSMIVQEIGYSSVSKEFLRNLTKAEKVFQGFDSFTQTSTGINQMGPTSAINSANTQKLQIYVP